MNALRETLLFLSILVVVPAIAVGVSAAIDKVVSIFDKEDDNA